MCYYHNRFDFCEENINCDVMLGKLKYFYDAASSWFVRSFAIICVIAIWDDMALVGKSNATCTTTYRSFISING